MTADLPGKSLNHPEKQAHLPTTGLTFADVLDSILSSKTKFITFVGLLLSVLGMTILAALVVVKLFHLHATEVRFSANDSHVVLEGVDEGTGNHEYVVVVNPEGWQNTGIPLEAGSQLTFRAGGRICIDMNAIWEEAQLRTKYEAEIARKLKIRQFDSTEKRVPEDFFSAEQKRSLVLSRPWVDPGGFSLLLFQPSFRSRHDRYLLPDKPAGSLVAAIKPGEDMPDASQAFFVGKATDRYEVKNGGELWFNVNDVQSTDPGNPNLFYNDNIGAFWVRISIQKR